MTWYNEGDGGGGAVMETRSPRSNQMIDNEVSEKWMKSCPSCGYKFQCKEQKKSGIHELPGFPAGVKFDPTDPELLEHLEGKVRMKTSKLHPLIDDFIPTLEGEDGICCTHPEQLPGVNKDGQVRHFFHCPSRAYTTGTRKRRKVQSNNENGSNGTEMRWHKTGKTRPVYINGKVKGYKKILVLYTNYGRHKKPEKTNWVMHQYHLGSKEEETDGEFVVSKVFFQIQPRQCSSTNKDILLIRSNMQGRCDQHKLTTSNDLISYDSSLMSIIAHHQTSNPSQLRHNLVIHSDDSFHH